MRLLLTCLLTTILASPLAAQWDLQTSHTTASLRGIHALGNGVAWASGTEGTVLRTTDDGAAWQTCPTPPAAEHLDFRGIQAFDQNTAIVMSSGKGDLSRLYKTTDGCQTWKLLFTNPDKEGFWDAVRFNYGDGSLPNSAFLDKRNGVILGDPVDSKFVIYQTLDSGETWRKWANDKSQRPALARKHEALFAASNSAVISRGVNGPFAFVTGGEDGSRLFLAQPHSTFDGASWLAFTIIPLSKRGTNSSGAFSVASRFPTQSPFADLMIVGGDYSKPDAPNTNAIYAPAPAFLFSRRTIAAQTPPHGYRSAVAYSPNHKAWITVGPNGTDLSTDNGKNWRALKPTPTEPPDADRNWNALSLPFAVGPKGRIGRLSPDALPAPPRRNGK